MYASSFGSSVVVVSSDESDVVVVSVSLCLAIIFILLVSGNETVSVVDGDGFGVSSMVCSTSKFIVDFVGSVSVSVM